MLDFYFSSLTPTSEEAEYLCSKTNGCVLLSQLNDRSHIAKWIEKNREAKNKVKLFIDSGAFTSWTKGATIDIDEYISYLNSISSEVTCYASLDVIPGVAGSSEIPTSQESMKASDMSWNNYLYMRSRVLHPDKLLYTFHIGENYKYLEDALNYSDEFGKVAYLGLGGIVGKTESDIIDFLDRCFEIIKNSRNPDVKVHTFGMTRFTTLKLFPIYSTDSTAYIKIGAFGSVMIDNVKMPISVNSEFEDSNIINRSTAVKEILDRELKRRGMTLDELRNSRDKRVLFNCISYYELMETYEYTPLKKVCCADLW